MTSELVITPVSKKICKISLGTVDGEYELEEHGEMAVAEPVGEETVADPVEETVAEPIGEEAGADPVGEELVAEPFGEEAGAERRRTGWSSGQKPGGLRGGGSGEQSRNHELRLINNKSKETRMICFVNSVIQLLRRSGYASFLNINLQHLLGISTGGHRYQLGQALAALYSGQNSGEVSAAPIRKLVAQHSGLAYLNDGTQQVWYGIY